MVCQVIDRKARKTAIVLKKREERINKRKRKRSGGAKGGGKQEKEGRKGDGGRGGEEEGKNTYDLRITDEYFSFTKFISRRGDFNFIKDDFTTRTRISIVFRPATFGNNTEALEELLISLTIGESSTSYTNIFHKTQILHLVHSEVGLNQLRSLPCIWTNATNIVGMTGH